MEDRIEHRQHSFGRPFRLILDAKDPTAADHVSAVTQELQKLESQFCSITPGSFTYELNRLAGSGEYTPVSPATRSLLQYVEALRQNSNAVYDPSTCLFDQSYSGGNDDAERVATRAPLVGWDQLEISDQGARLPLRNMLVDLNNVVRPFAVDRLRGLLGQRGVGSAMIDLDRDVATLGKQPDGANWMPGIRYPRGSGGAFAKVKLNGRALAVRGDFERCLLRDGRRLPRAYDPASGQPIEGLLTVAVIADHSLEAAGAASVARLMPEQAALQWLDSLDMPWLAIDRELACLGPLAQALRLPGSSGP